MISNFLKDLAFLVMEQKTGLKKPVIQKILIKEVNRLENGQPRENRYSREMEETIDWYIENRYILE